MPLFLSAIQGPFPCSISSQALKRHECRAPAANSVATRLFFLLALLLNVMLFCARAEEAATGPEAGRKLAAELRSMRPEENSKWTGTLKIKHNHKTVTIPILCETTLGDSNSAWTVTYQTSATDTMGAEKLTVIFSTNGPNQYFLAQAASPGGPLGEPKKLDGAAADVPLAGSDFWLSDLGMEFYHWPQQERLTGARPRGRPSYVLESINPHPSPDGYLRVKTSIDEESGAPLEAVAYGPDNKELKIFDLGGFKRVDGHYRLEEIEMINRQTDSRTHIVFDLEKK